MKRPPPSRYSEDGRWWWDGEQWQPVEGAPPVERGVALVAVETKDAGREEKEEDERPRSLGASLVVAGLVTASLFALATAIWPPGTISPLPYLNQGSVRREITTAPAVPTSPAPTPTATATATVSGAQRYRDAVAQGGKALSTQIDAAGTDCAPPANLGSCRGALVSLRQQVATYRSELDAAHAPACMSAADGQVRHALDLLDGGASQAVTGIDDATADQIMAGSRLVQQASQQMSAARRQVDAAQC